jgi:hypothetical protein
MFADCFDVELKRKRLDEIKSVCESSLSLKLDSELLIDLDDVLFEICREDCVLCLSFCKFVNKIVDHVFLKVPCERCSGNAFPDNNVLRMKSMTIPRS